MFVERDSDFRQRYPMALPTPLGAVVFDLDGTLIDSADDLGAAANRLLAREGRRPLEAGEVRRFIGDGTRVFVDRAWSATGTGVAGAELDDLARRFIAEYESDVAGLTRPYPGAAETLATLKRAGLRLGVCTNKPQAPAEQVIAALGLGAWVDMIAGGDRFAYRKPDPRHLLSALELLGVAPANAVMVGDNEHDMAVAHGAGTGAVLVSYGYARTPLAEIEADARIDTLAELIDILGLG